MTISADDAAAGGAGSSTERGTFSFQAQTSDGQVLSGTLEAADGNQVRNWLTGLGLRLLSLSPLSRQARPKAMRGEDFAAFNQQLAQLTAAGLPVETGLRLIAQDVRSGRLAATIRQVADELDRGRPLAEAFEAHRNQFPPLYGRLIDAGVRSHNLPAMLLNLGRHVELVYRLRATLWQAAAYPAAILAALLAVVVFLGYFVLPRYRDLYVDFDVPLPTLTQTTLAVIDRMPYVTAGLLAVIVVGVAIVVLGRSSAWGRAVVEKVVFPLPLIGPVLHRNLLARWCDAVRLGIDAGLDLPASLELAADAVASPTFRRASRELTERLAAGQPLYDPQQFGTIPASVLSAIDQASRTHQLSATLASLARMYQDQAMLRIASLPMILTPLLMILIGLFVGLVLMSLFLPLVTLMRSVS